MPHVVVKLFPGRSDADKKRLADRITLAVMDTIGSSETSISVAVEDVPPDDWGVKVYDSEIAAHPETLFKKPGYDRF